MLILVLAVARVCRSVNNPSTRIFISHKTYRTNKPRHHERRPNPCRQLPNPALLAPPGVAAACEVEAEGAPVPCPADPKGARKGCIFEQGLSFRAGLFIKSIAPVHPRERKPRPPTIYAAYIWIGKIPSERLLHHKYDRYEDAVASAC